MLKSRFKGIKAPTKQFWNQDTQVSSLVIAVLLCEISRIAACKVSPTTDKKRRISKTRMLVYLALSQQSH